MFVINSLFRSMYNYQIQNNSFAVPGLSELHNYNYSIQKFNIHSSMVQQSSCVIDFSILTLHPTKPSAITFI